MPRVRPAAEQRDARLFRLAEKPAKPAVFSPPGGGGAATTTFTRGMIFTFVASQPYRTR